MEMTGLYSNQLSVVLLPWDATVSTVYTWYIMDLEFLLTLSFNAASGQPRVLQLSQQMLF